MPSGSKARECVGYLDTLSGQYQSLSAERNAVNKTLHAVAYRSHAVGGASVKLLTWATPRESGLAADGQFAPAVNASEYIFFEW